MLPWIYAIYPNKKWFAVTFRVHQTLCLHRIALQSRIHLYTHCIHFRETLHFTNHRHYVNQPTWWNTLLLFQHNIILKLNCLHHPFLNTLFQTRMAWTKTTTIVRRCKKWTLIGGVLLARLPGNANGPKPV